ncbi:DUF695 domain-containing protein [Kaistella jeonii]|nr:DUF695 domain-containing protein [Kaistella jeonii]
MENQGSNLNQKMLWGYFFTSNKKDKFDQIANELKNQNFKFVEVYQDVDKSYWLHLERKEIHNPQSLFELDKILYKIADKYEITYDGFDVGNVDKDKAIERNTYVVPEEFKTIDFQKNNFPCLLIGNTAFDRFPHKEEFCYFIKITTSYEKDGKVLLPTNEELEKLNDFEFFIENSLNENKIKNYYVFRDTYKGIRNFYFVTNDKNDARKTLELIEKSGKSRPFQFEILTDKNWNLYYEFRKKMPNE